MSVRDSVRQPSLVRRWLRGPRTEPLPERAEPLPKAIPAQAPGVDDADGVSDGSGFPLYAADPAGDDGEDSSPQFAV